MSYNCVQFEKFGAPLDVLSFTKVSGVPVPAYDEIIVQVTASSVCPFDQVVTTSPFVYGPDTKLPASPGCEGVGIVYATGAKVTQFKVGQRLAFYSHIGAWSEYVVLKSPFNLTVAVPDSVPDTAAAQFAINTPTIYGLFDHSKPSPNDWILQTGAASVLGQMAIEIAKAKKLKLINLVHRQAQVADLKSRYGSDTHVVVFDGTNETEALAQINTITENKGVNIVFEAVGGKTFDFALKALAIHGHILSFGALSRTFEVPVSVITLLTKVPKIEGFVVTPWFNKKSPAEQQKIIDALMELMASKKLVPAVEAVYPLEQFKEALIKANTPGKLGRVFLAAHPEEVTKN